MQPSLPNPLPESPKNPLIISVDTPSDSFIKMAEAEGLKSIPIAQDILGKEKENAELIFIKLKDKTIAYNKSDVQLAIFREAIFKTEIVVTTFEVTDSYLKNQKNNFLASFTLAELSTKGADLDNWLPLIQKYANLKPGDPEFEKLNAAFLKYAIENEIINQSDFTLNFKISEDDIKLLFTNIGTHAVGIKTLSNQQSAAIVLAPDAKKTAAEKSEKENLVPARIVTMNTLGTPLSALAITPPTIKEQTEKTKENSALQATSAKTQAVIKQEIEKKSAAEDVKLAFDAKVAEITKKTDAAKEKYRKTVGSIPRTLVMATTLDVQDLKKRVAHINGDLFIAQSGLEGHSAKSLMPYLHRVLVMKLEELEKKSKTITETSDKDKNAATIKQISHLLKGLSRGLFINMQDTVVKNDPVARDLKPIVNTTIASIEGLQVGESIIVAGGWTSLLMGHAMYYEVTRQENNTFGLKVFNTGAGLDYHHSIKTFEPDAAGRDPKLIEKHLPFVEYTGISLERMTDESFWTAMNELTHCRLMDTEEGTKPTKFNATYIYERLLPYLSGTPVRTSVSDKDNYIVQQNSGICAWAGLNAILHTYLPKSEFTRLEHDIQVASILELYNSYSDLSTLAADETTQLLLKKSAEQLASFSLQRFKNKTITVEEFEQSNALVGFIKAHVQGALEVAQKIADDKAQIVKFTATNPTPFQALGGIQLYEAPPEISDVTSTRWNEKWVPKPATITQDLTAFLIKYRNATTEVKAVAYCLRSLFAALPIPSNINDPFWSQIPPAQMEECMTTILMLSELMHVLEGKYNLSSYPERRVEFITSFYKGQAILHKLASQDKELQSLGIAHWKFMSDDIENCFFSPNSDKTGNTQIYDKDTLAQLKAIHGYFGSQETSHANFFDFKAYLRGFEQIDTEASNTDTESAFVVAYYRQHAKRLGEIDEIAMHYRNAQAGKPNDDIPLKMKTLMTDYSGKMMPMKYCLIKKMTALTVLCMHKQTLNSIDDTHKQTTQAKNPIVNWNYSPYRYEGPKPLANTNKNFSTTAPSLCVEAWHHKNEYSHIPSLADTLAMPLDHNSIYNDQLNTKGISPSTLVELRSIWATPIKEGGRYAQELQIPKLLDYFKLNINELEDFDLQRFFTRLLFDRDQLIILVTKNPDYLNQITSFIQSGFAHFKERHTIRGATFMVQLQQMVLDRLNNIDNKELSEAVSKLKELDPNSGRSGEACLVDLLKEKVSIADKNLIYRQLLFGYSLDWPTWSEEKRKSQVPMIVKLIALRDSNPEYIASQNSYLSNAISTLAHKMTPYLDAAIKSSEGNQHGKLSPLTLIVMSIADSLGLINPQTKIDWANIRWENKSPPICSGTINGQPVLLFDSISFALSVKAEGVGLLPHRILEHPDFMNNFPGIKEQKAIPLSLNTYSFKDKKNNEVIVKYDSYTGALTIDREFVSNGPRYRLMKIDDITSVGITNKTLMENQTIWIEKYTTPPTVLLCTSGTFKINYRLLSLDKRTYNIYREDKRNLTLLKSNNPTYQQLSSFESPDYTQIWTDLDSNKPKLIEMPRLSLTFNIENDKAVCNQVTGYHIAEKQNIPSLANFKTYLVLQKIENGKTITKVLIPRQQKALGYTKGGLDTSFKLSGEFPPGFSKYPHYYEYTLDAKGELEASREGGNLYLAYILLGQGRYEEAHKCLEEKSHKLKRYGAREREIFSWISNLISIGDNDPKLSAVYLKAIALQMKNQQIHGSHEKLETGSLYMQYTNYLSLLNSMGKLLLSVSDETLLLKILIKQYPEDPFLKERLAIVTNDMSTGLKLPSQHDTKHLQNYDIAKIEARTIHTALHDFIPWQVDEKELKATVSDKEVDLTHLIVLPDVRQKNNFSHFRELYELAKNVPANKVAELQKRFELESVFSKNKSMYAFLIAVAADRTGKLYPDYASLVKMRASFDDDLREKYRTLLKSATQQFNAYVDATISRQMKEKAIAIEIGTEKIATASQADVKEISAASVQTTRLKKSIPPEALPESNRVTIPPSLRAAPELVKELFSVATRDASRKEELSSAAQLQKEMAQKQLPPRCRLEEIERKKFNDDIQAYADIEANTSVKTLLNTNKRETLLKNVKEASDKVNTQLNLATEEIVKLHDRIIDLANKIPTENLTEEQRVQNAKHNAELLSGQKELFTINDLTVSFLNNNMKQFVERNPNLTKADVADLKSMVTTFLLLRTEEQAAQRQIQALNGILTYVEKFPARDALENDPTFKELGDKAFQELTNKREYNPLTQYHLLVFEAMTAMALRKDQVDNIEKMTKSSHLILQMIMGAGKSTVLLPILALNQADGVHLPIVILPAPLYESTIHHTRKCVGGAFKRSVQTLSFDRQTEFSVDKLQNILRYLNEIRDNRECLMMTSKSVHCVALKFKEAMIDFSNNPNDPELRQQADLIRQILKMFKDQGRAIIDEADLVLNVRSEVNFTLGKTVYLEKTRCQLVGNLCSYLCDPQIIKMCGRNPLEGIPLNPEIYKTIKLTLINKVMSAASKNSYDPLNKFFAPLNAIQKTHVTNYLTGARGLAAEKFIEQIKDAQVKDLLALLKEELNNILPLTLSKRYCVDYGPSLKKTGEGQLLAIPYNGNNSPVEGSEFRSPDILMNYTAQTLWKQGIPQSEIFRYVETLKKDAAKEKLTKGLSSENQTEAYKIFQTLLGKGLEDIKFFNCTSEDCQRITESINASRKDDPSRFFNYIAQCVFPQIKLSESQLTSNAIDLPGMFKTAVGFTGTPWNAPSYEENLFAKTESAPGVDGKTAVLLYEKVSRAKDGIRTLNAVVPSADKSKPSFMVSLPDLIRPEDDALIDTGAVFNGQANGAVAQEILKLLQNRNSNLKGVVYFHKNKAVVLELRADGVPHTVPLDQSTLKPEQRFTYYDQPHTTGTDILQHRYAKATLTISKEMTTRDLFQGAWRFRGLDKQQSVSFALIGIAEESIRKSCNLPLNSPIQYAHILQYTNAQQAEQQIEHLKTSMKPKIENILKREVYNALLQTDLGEKARADAAQLIKALHPILVSTPSTSPYVLYGKQDALLTREEIIKDMQESALKKIKDVSPALLRFSDLEQGFKGLATLGLLPDKMLSTTGNQADASVEKEQEKESEKERELQLEINVQVYNANQFNFQRHQRWADERNPPDIFFKQTFVPFAQPSPLQAANFVNLNKFYGKEHHQIFDFGGPLLAGMLANANRLPTRGDHGNILAHKQLPTDYVLFVREKDKKDNSLKMILLDSPSDLACYWTALSDARQKKHYANVRREVELCICNLNGDVIQHDGSIDFDDRRSHFVNALRTEGESLRVRAKLALGELFYSPSEIEVVRAYIKAYGKDQLEKYYKEIILKSDPQKQQLFERTPLFLLFGKPQWAKTLASETAAKQKKEAEAAK